MSRCARGDLKTFLAARSLRIFPAIIVCTLLSAVVWGPLLTTLDVGAYFKAPHLCTFLAKNTVLLPLTFQDSLPGVFLTNPFRGGFNGSLWTLPCELRMYLVVAVAGSLGLLKGGRGSAILLAGLIALVTLVEFHWLNHMRWTLYAFFLCGMLFWMNRELIPCSGWIALALGVISAGTYRSILFPFLGSAFLVYAVFWSAYVPGGIVRKFNLFGDYSYGLYIYAFPVQQSIALAFPGITPMAMCALALPCTLVLAIASWHLVERPALALKDNSKFVRQKEERFSPIPSATETVS